MKKCSRLCSEAGTRGLISREARGLQAAKSCTRAEHAGELNSQATWSTTRQKSRLAIKLARGLNSRLSQVARSSHQPALFLEKLTLCIPFSHQYKYPSFPQNMCGHFHGFSPTKPKTHAVWVRKDLLRWVLFTCSWFNSFNYLWTCFCFCFWLFCFLVLFKKIQKHWKFSKKQKIYIYIYILCLVLFFLRITWIIISLSI